MTLHLARTIQHSALTILVGLTVILALTGCQGVPSPSGSTDPIVSSRVPSTGPATNTSQIPTAPLPKAVKTKVVRVVDGDTVVVQATSDLQPTTGAGLPEPGKSAAAATQHTVRLLGIDAPEMNYGKGVPPECGALAATDHLNGMLPKDIEVTVTYDQTPGMDPTDRYGRSLAYISTSSVADVNRAQAVDGYAEAWIPESAAQPERWDDSTSPLPNCPNTQRPAHTGHPSTARASAANELREFSR